ncbi:nucleoside transporter-domain-containing protein [Hygrophoropsis aurantiaca]|uniref:Nucleoside transporter-domain-containing protein n=1 Tax=Hygrophoropsis aurantiaca TaxID=72124 RepID=A0ACB8AV63_9AGAM|nr:nucleoside transporter-domain-containing protein [Hygrophoropsis aurantiaca]
MYRATDVQPDDTYLWADTSPTDSDATPSLPLPEILVDKRIQTVYFMLGSAALLPWNALITATPFFLSRLTGSPLRATFSSYMSSSYTGCMLMFIARATATSKQNSPSRRFFIATGSLTILVASLCLSTFIFVPPDWFFFFVIINAIGQAAGAAFLSTAVYAGASLFGAPYMQAVMAGQAAVAVAVSGVQVLSSMASIWGATPDLMDIPSEFGNTKAGVAEAKAARMFFGISTLFLIATFMAYRWLTTLPVYKARVGILEQQAKALSSSSDVEERRALLSSGFDMDSSDNKSQLWRVFKANIPYELAAFLGFTVTLAVFPPITVSIMSTNPAVHPLLFSAVHFLVFNLGDFAGRYICSFPRLIMWSARRVLTIAILRALFIPIFLICNVQRTSTEIISPIISSDFLYLSILAAFGLTNGYVSTLCMLGAPSLEHNPRLKGRREDVDVAATLASFGIISGLAIGSFTSFAVRAVICDCNPFRQ